MKISESTNNQDEFNISKYNNYIKKGIEYGCDNLGKLKSVLIHTPGEELKLINKSNYKEWLFDKSPDIENFVKEHLSYQDILASYGIKLYELSDFIKVNKNLLSVMPNIIHKIQVG